MGNPALNGAPVQPAYLMLLAVLVLLFPPPAVRAAAPAETIKLPPPHLERGLPLMQAINRRQSRRLFASRPLPAQTLGDLLWAAYGVNRPASGMRTAPSAHNRQEIEVYAATAQGLYLYLAKGHELRKISDRDIRSLTGRQDFPGRAPLGLVYVVDFSRMKGVPRADAIEAAAISTGAIVENVYLYCASEGLAVVARGWIDRRELAAAMGLDDRHYIILAQTVGYPVR